MESFEQVKIHLKKTNANGESFYQLLTDVLRKINHEKPPDAKGSLEKISVAVKRAVLINKQFKEGWTTQSKATTDAIAELEKSLKLFDNIPKVSEADRAAVEASQRATAAADEEEEGAKEKALALLPDVMKGPHIPNILGSNNMLNSAGTGYSKEEAFQIWLSLKGLAKTNSEMSSIRFFGQIHGTEKDYYIAEVKFSGKFPKTEDPATKKEPRGYPGRSNEFVYYVTNSIEGEWQPLPDVLPAQIITARKMCRFLTGNLHASVEGYPRFPWPEASLLRAQIARIASATTISPKGYFTMEEAEEEDGPEEMKADPEFEAPSAEDLRTTEGWAHHRAFLFKEGRHRKWEAPEAEEEEEEEPEEAEEEEEEEEGVPILGGLEADESKANPEMWKFRGTGGQYDIVSVHSAEWPGAVAVAKGQHFANIYIGWGKKSTGALYAPPPLPPVQSEYTSGFNKEEAEEDEVDPSLEQTDPPPPEVEADEGDDDEGDDE
jgi:radial spoke head protein 4A